MADAMGTETAAMLRAVIMPRVIVSCTGSGLSRTTER
jgi:hypothetical protein